MEKIDQIICTYRKLNGISQEESIYSFLKFAVYFLLDGFYKQITPMDCKPYLGYYLIFVICT